MAAPTNYPHSKEASPESSIIHNAQKRLEKCENYFIFWLGDSKLEKDMLGPMTQDLYGNIGQIADDSDEADEAKDQSGKKKAETKKQFKKSRKQNDHGTVEEEEDETEQLNTEEKIEEKHNDPSTSSNDEESDDEDKKIKIVDGGDLQRALALLIECFLNIHVGDIVLAKKLIVRCTNYIESLIPLNDSLKAFVPGFDFLKCCLEIDLGVKENSSDVRKKVGNPAFGLIDELLDKSKAMIYAAKWMFLELFENRNRHESLDALKNVTIHSIRMICDYLKYFI